MIGLFSSQNRIAGSYLLHAANGDDLAGAGVFDIFTLIRVHLHQPTDALHAYP